MDTNTRRKKITLILAALVLVVAIVHLVVFIFLNINGKRILQNYIKTNFAAEAQISSVSFRFPFTVVVKGFKCDDVEFNKADVSLGLFNPFNHSISLRKVYIDKLNFKVKIEKDKFTIVPFFVKQTTQAQPQPVQAEETKVTPPPQKAKPKAISVKIGKLLINNASAQVLDLTKDKQIAFNLRSINIMLKHFIYPQLPKFYLEVNASLDKDELKSDNLIALKGWVDYGHRNMDVKFNINNADYIMFSDYYPPFWKPNNLGLKEAKLSLDSKINSLNNDLVIEAILALDKIEFLEEMQNDSRANSLKTMIAFFKGENGKPMLPIKLRTKMDSFHIDFASLQSEFKGKMKLDIGTIVINILDKAKGKITETTKEVKNATIDKAVDKTKEAATTVKDVTVDKAANTIKGVVGAIDNAISGKKEEKPAERPVQTTAQPVQQGQQPPQAQIKTEENVTSQSTQSQQTNIKEQGTAPSAQANTQTQTPGQGMPANTGDQNQPQPAQAQPAQ